MVNSRKRIFITGIAGFIGFHLAQRLIARGDEVVGCDHFGDYYSPELKQQRAAQLPHVIDADVCKGISRYLEEHQATHLVHLAAQAGVRKSITHPECYKRENLDGFFEVLEALRERPETKLVFASSSSVYGHNKKIPFAEDDKTDAPANFYGATKKANELMAYSYHKLFGFSAVGLRFFTVYGPWGRPDMAYYSFTKAIDEGTPIRLFNRGNMQRDFTYIDDIVDGIIAAIDRAEGFEIFNLGNHRPEPLLDLVKIIEDHLGKKAKLELLPMQPGEIQTTFADILKAEKLLNFSPKISLAQGMENFLGWYEEHCRIKSPLIY